MITSTGAVILLVASLPVAIWATVTDLKSFRIPNKAVLAMMAIWPLLGWLAVPTWTAWFWGFAILGIAFVIAYLAFAVAGFPGGDAKYAAAISPMFVGGSIAWILTLIATCMIGALLVHILLGKIPAVRRLTPDWQSWGKRMFPFGLALSAILIVYLVAAIWPQV